MIIILGPVPVFSGGPRIFCLGIQNMKGSYFYLFIFAIFLSAEYVDLYLSEQRKEG